MRTRYLYCLACGHRYDRPNIKRFCGPACRIRHDRKDVLPTEAGLVRERLDLAKAMEHAMPWEKWELQKRIDQVSDQLAMVQTPRQSQK